ncbi:MAG TPA: oxidoreductase [Candidatus Angelobacter sp.]|jgi:NAD(P)-dependent dehydrogenase (short-subunit alcohol dehydrogenase family)|nr:oxidoreductase [Candidatus Angelobacter sp.]
MTGKWTADQIPDQRGRTAIVTGANSGLGFVVARELARSGARVIVASRDTDKGAKAMGAIKSAHPAANVEVAQLDLASLASVRAFAERFRAGHNQLDLLINNAGIMAAPHRRTADGFELQLGTNHLGHFALTGLLMPAFNQRLGTRVATMSSNLHKGGQIDFDDLQGEQHYSRWGAYGQSKLANLLFALELDRRLKAAGLPMISVAAHPGYSSTNLQLSGPPLQERIVMRLANRLFAQPAEMGALPMIYAATYPDLPGGSYVGPDGPREARGYPTLVQPSERAKDPAAAKRLWEISEQLTGVKYELLKPAAA